MSSKIGAKRKSTRWRWEKSRRRWNLVVISSVAERLTIIIRSGIGRSLRNTRWRDGNTTNKSSHYEWTIIIAWVCCGGIRNNRLIRSNSARCLKIRVLIGKTSH